MPLGPLVAKSRDIGFHFRDVPVNVLGSSELSWRCVPAGVMHPKNQLGFLEVIVVPMFTLLHHVLPGPDGVLRGLTQLRATADFYRRPNSVTVTAQSLETFREELVAISTERYESIVGSTLDGNLLGATSSKGITVSARGLVEDHSSREKPISEISPASFDLPPGVDME